MSENLISSTLIFAKARLVKLRLRCRWLQQVRRREKENQLAFAALQVKERQVRMEREEEEGVRKEEEEVLSSWETSSSFLFRLDSDCIQSSPTKGFAWQTFNCA